MVIKKSDIEKFAKLAKLEFSETEKEKLTHQLSEILSYVKKLSELDLENVKPTSHVLDIKNVLREDKVEPWLTQEDALYNAPATKLGFFSVPKVIYHE